MRPPRKNRRISPNKEWRFRGEIIIDREELKRPRPLQCTNEDVRVAIHERDLYCEDCTLPRYLGECRWRSSAPACELQREVLYKLQRRSAFLLVLLCLNSTAPQPWRPWQNQREVLKFYSRP